jgi:hypothetical protein
MTVTELEIIGRARWGNRWIISMADYLSAYRSTIYDWKERGEVPRIKAKKVAELSSTTVTR